MNLRLIIYSCAACLLIACSGAAQPPPSTMTFEECASAGNPIRRTNPAQCVTADGIVIVAEPTRSASNPFCQNLCGDGTCQEIVCMGLECPCAETAATCPADCKQ